MMNERIKQLILKAGFHPFVRGEQILFDISTEENLKEFAELIVRECNSKLDNIGVIDRDSRTIAMKVISEHFGVEE
jgi:hypothetical protein